MNIDAFDPEDDEVDSVSLNVGRDRFMLAYYEPFLAASGFRDSLKADGITRTEFEAFGVSIDLLTSVEDRVRAAADGAVQGLADDVNTALARANEGLLLHPDGSRFRTQWEGALSLTDWDETSTRQE